MVAGGLRRLKSQANEAVGVAGIGGWGKVERMLLQKEREKKKGNCLRRRDIRKKGASSMGTTPDAKTSEYERVRTLEVEEKTKKIPEEEKKRQIKGNQASAAETV